MKILLTILISMSFVSVYASTAESDGNVKCQGFLSAIYDEENTDWDLISSLEGHFILERATQCESSVFWDGDGKKKYSDLYAAENMSEMQNELCGCVDKEEPFKTEAEFDAAIKAYIKLEQMNDISLMINAFDKAQDPMTHYLLLNRDEKKAQKRFEKMGDHYCTPMGLRGYFNAVHNGDKKLCSNSSFSSFHDILNDVKEARADCSVEGDCQSDLLTHIKRDGSLGNQLQNFVDVKNKEQRQLYEREYRKDIEKLRNLVNKELAVMEGDADELSVLFNRANRLTNDEKQLIERMAKLPQFSFLFKPDVEGVEDDLEAELFGIDSVNANQVFASLMVDIKNSGKKAGDYFDNMAQNAYDSAKNSCKQMKRAYQGFCKKVDKAESKDYRYFSIKDDNKLKSLFARYYAMKSGLNKKDKQGIEKILCYARSMNNQNFNSSNLVTRNLQYKIKQSKIFDDITDEKAMEMAQAMGANVYDNLNDRQRSLHSSNLSSDLSSLASYPSNELLNNPSNFYSSIQNANTGSIGGQAESLNNISSASIVSNQAPLNSAVSQPQSLAAGATTFGNGAQVNANSLGAVSSAGAVGSNVSSASKQPVNQISGYNELNNRLKQLEDEKEKLRSELAAMKEKSKDDSYRDSQEYKSNQQEIIDLNNQISKLQGNLDEYESGNGSILPTTRSSLASSFGSAIASGDAVADATAAPQQIPTAGGSIGSALSGGSSSSSKVSNKDDDLDGLSSNVSVTINGAPVNFNALSLSKVTQSDLNKAPVYDDKIDLSKTDLGDNKVIYIKSSESEGLYYRIEFETQIVDGKVVIARNSDGKPIERVRYPQTFIDDGSGAVRAIASEAEPVVEEREQTYKVDDLNNVVDDAGVADRPIRSRNWQ